VSVPLYMDVNVRIEITQGLRRRGVDVLRAQEDAAARLLDARLLDRSTALGRTLFSHDADLIVEAAERQLSGRTFAGVVYAHQLGITIGQLHRRARTRGESPRPARAHERDRLPPAEVTPG
jgi:hypothetical protein